MEVLTSQDPLPHVAVLRYSNFQQPLKVTKPLFTQKNNKTAAIT